MAWPSAVARCRLVPMLAPIGDVLGVARQGSERLLVAVGKPHALG